MINQNLQQIEKHICNACNRVGRNRSEVTLIAVSKTKPVSDIQEAYNLGIRDFGENKVQELEFKFQNLPTDIRWHMIGHLQRNKIKYILPQAALIHSVDSFRLAEAIEKEAVKENCTVSILIEVNIGNEISKYGASLDEVLPLVQTISKLPHIRIKGLMAVAPLVENAEQNRPLFSKLRKLFVDIACKNIDNVTMSILSMGMTNDYIVAIEEGATMVRVGTGIFGERNYTLTN